MEVPKNLGITLEPWSLGSVHPWNMAATLLKFKSVVFESPGTHEYQTLFESPGTHEYQTLCVFWKLYKLTSRMLFWTALNMEFKVCNNLLQDIKSM